MDCESIGLPVQRQTRRGRGARATGWYPTRPRRAPRWRAPAGGGEHESCRSRLPAYL